MSQGVSSDITGTICRPVEIEECLDFILTQFEVPRWSRRISTKSTEGGKTPAHNKEVSLARFKQANYVSSQ
jgi:hypothetical protein